MSFHRRVDTKVSRQLKINTEIHVTQAAKEKPFFMEVIYAFYDGVPRKAFSPASEVPGYQHLSPFIYQQYILRMIRIDL